MNDEFTEADHERARRAGQQAMAKQAAKQPRKRGPHPGWRFLFGWLTFTQFAAFVLAIVHLFHSVAWDGTAGIVGRLVMWPLIVHPPWLAAVLAFAAFLVVGLVWEALSSRQEVTEE
jgi:hypothetical protein